MTELKLFTDGSVNTKLKIGFGAILFVSTEIFDFDKLKSQVQLKRFEETSSTKLEIQTLLWALSNLPKIDGKIIIYTDSQNIIGLPKRRDKLEKNNYSSKKNKLIKNHLLYKDFFNLIDTFNCEFVQVNGHKSSSQKDEIDQIFTLVDRASRNAVRDMGKYLPPD
ncbi:MAG: ribonuclease H [Bacteroidetes bacterium]|nr:ribonuclease H [Bacteroidota bacterium]MBU1114509.1 ribonuclease H [Bacteroidota bacterium]MBU1799693.1 ribonuclease H [Bacteroidota bacterium]